MIDKWLVSDWRMNNSFCSAAKALAAMRIAMREARRSEGGVVSHEYLHSRVQYLKASALLQFLP